MKALVIIPTYNEKENLPAIVPQVLAQDDRISVLVVDDNSPDGTGQIADAMADDNSRIHVLHRSKKEGLGRAYLAGFEWALEHDFELIFEMDADFSHDPKYLMDFLSRESEADLLLGSRYVKGGGVENWPRNRYWLSKYANVYARIVTGLPVRDSTGGFKCFHRRVLESIDFNAVKTNGYGFQIEMSFRAWKKGFKIVEIPIVFTDRSEGASKMSRAIVYEAIGLVPKLRWWALTGKIT